MMPNKKFKILLILLLFVLTGMVCSGCAESEMAIIKIGAPLPLTGPYALEGNEMKMVLEMAVSEQNAKGGLIGQKLVLVVHDLGAEEDLSSLGEKFLDEEVSLLITGHTGIDKDVMVFGAYGLPYLHANYIAMSSYLSASELEHYNNVFQFRPAETTYGHDTAENLFEVPLLTKGWHATNRKIAVIRTDNSFSVNASDIFMDIAQRNGYEIVVNETAQPGIDDWYPIFKEVAVNLPVYVTLWAHDPQDAASFANQFKTRFTKGGYNGMVYIQHVPGYPVFLTQVEELSNGIVWSTNMSAISSDVSDYSDRWYNMFGVEPKTVYAYSMRDAFEIWVEAVENAGCANCYSQIIKLINDSSYSGYCGRYKFSPESRQVLAGDNYIPTLWYQVQKGEHVITGPYPYKENDYNIPPLVK